MFNSGCKKHNQRLSTIFPPPTQLALLSRREENRTSTMRTCLWVCDQRSMNRRDLWCWFIALSPSPLVCNYLLGGPCGEGCAVLPVLPHYQHRCTTLPCRQCVHHHEVWITVAKWAVIPKRTLFNHTLSSVTIGKAHSDAYNPWLNYI